MSSIVHSTESTGGNVAWEGSSSPPGTVASGSVLAAYSLQYDQANRLSSFSSYFDGFKTSYAYDTRDQLTAATSAQIAGLEPPFTLPPSETYSFDATGNRQQGGTSTSSNGTHNRVANDGTYSYQYDNEGNQTARTRLSNGQVTTYEYDQRNRLVKVTQPGSIVTYRYDGLDRRVNRQVAGGSNGTIDQSTVWVWDGDQVLFEFEDSDGDGANSFELARRYLWGPGIDMLLADEPVDFETSGVENVPGEPIPLVLWALADHLGSVRDLIDSSGIRREHNLYDSFGNLLMERDYNIAGYAISSTSPEAVDSIFGFTAREWDEHIKMQYNRFRWYDPTTGRWLGQDPIGFGGGQTNLYGYVGNEVTTHIDPSGLMDWIPPELRAYPGQVGRFWKGYFWNGPKNVVTGTASAIYNYEDTLEGVMAAVADPKAAYNAIANEYHEKSLTAEGQGEIVFDVATAVVGATKAAKAAKLKKLQSLKKGTHPDVPKHSPKQVPVAPERVPQKRGPKTDPNTPHNHTIRTHGDLIETGGSEIVAGGGKLPEQLIPTPGGVKGGRRPDILFRTQDGTLRGRNVGKCDANGNPVKREQEALDDLNGPGGIPTDFVPYDR